MFCLQLFRRYEWFISLVSGRLTTNWLQMRGDWCHLGLSGTYSQRSSLIGQRQQVTGYTKSWKTANCLSGHISIALSAIGCICIYTILQPLTLHHLELSSFDTHNKEKNPHKKNCIVFLFQNIILPSACSQMCWTYSAPRDLQFQHPALIQEVVWPLCRAVKSKRYWEQLKHSLMNTGKCNDIL